VNVSFNFRNILPFNITLTFMDNPPIDHIFDCVNIVTSKKWMTQYVSNIHNRLALLKWPTVLSQQLDVMIITNRCTCLMFNVLSFASFSVVHVCVFTTRCTLMQSAVLRSHVVSLSETLVNCDHIGWNSSKIISPLVSLGRLLFATSTWRVCSKGAPLNLGPKWPTPLLIWASETFDCKLRPNGYR